MEMRTIAVIFTLAVIMVTMAVPSEASLTTIGSATYEGSNYNLIYDKESSLIWLDYSSPIAIWPSQNAWAANLGTTLTNITLKTGYSGINWSSGWRLPSTVDGPSVFGYDGTTTAGYNITSSELGHLYYTELGNKGYYDTHGIYQPGFGLTNKGPFENLMAYWYWSGTENNPPANAWYFGTHSGNQSAVGWYSDGLAMAVRSGQVVEAATPIPAASWLLGSGLMGLVGLRRRMKV